MKLEKKSAPIDPAIFDSFNKLISHDEKVRIKGATVLIKTIEESDEDKVSLYNFLKMCSILRFPVLVAKAAGLYPQATHPRKWILDFKLTNRLLHSSHRSAELDRVERPSKSCHHHRDPQEGVPDSRGQGKGRRNGRHSARLRCNHQS